MKYELIFVGSFLAFLINTYFIIWIYRGLHKISRNHASKRIEHYPYSIIIAAHNEEKHIADCLKQLIHQNYPDELYEIIVVADRCSDRTARIARDFQSRFSALKVLEVTVTPPHISPKKYALTRGIEGASFNRFLFLDADVVPHEDFIATMNRNFQADTAAVVSLMKILPQASFWNCLVRFERILTWSIAAAGVGHRKPALAFGGSWGYTREAFEKVGGFTSLAPALSGDDDLLIQQFRKYRLLVQFCSEAKGWVWTWAPQYLREFVRQRRRHFSASKYYLFPIKVGYFLYHGSNLFLWAAGWTSLSAFLFLVFKLLFDGVLIARARTIFREDLPLVMLPVFELFYVLYNSLVGPLGWLGRPRW